MELTSNWSAVNFPQIRPHRVHIKIPEVSQEAGGAAGGHAHSVVRGGDRVERPRLRETLERIIRTAQIAGEGVRVF